MFATYKNFNYGEPKKIRYPHNESIKVDALKVYSVYCNVQSVCTNTEKMFPTQ